MSRSRGENLRRAYQHGRRVERLSAARWIEDHLADEVATAITVAYLDGRADGGDDMSGYDPERAAISTALLAHMGDAIRGLAGQVRDQTPGVASGKVASGKGVAVGRSPVRYGSGRLEPRTGRS